MEVGPQMAPPTDGDPVIRTVDLTKIYPGGKVAAVDRLDLEISEGEIFGLLGPNGAGKTTTVGMLTTRVVPTSGSAFLAGVDVVAHPTRAKRLLGVVSQTNTLDRSLTVWENLYFHGRYFGLGQRQSRQVADRLLEVFRLTERANADVAALSGGMAQRLMVARGIAHRPRILFLDEPTSGLDPQSRIALWEIIREIHADGQTVLLTTHYMDEADRLCDRVAIMDHGRILAMDTPDALKRTVGGDTVVRIVADGDGARLADSMRRMPGVADARPVDGAVVLTMRGSDGALPQALAHAEREGLSVRDLSIDEPTLETVFINLTGKELRE